MLRPSSLLLSFLLACGPDAADSEPAPSSGTDGAAAGGPSSSAAEPTGAPTTAPADTTGAVTTSVGATADATGEPPAGTTGGVDVEYAAFLMLDFILIYRADFTHGRCLTLRLARDIDADPSLQITSPEGWAVLNAAIVDETEGCLAGTPAGDPVLESGGAGTVSWPRDPRQSCPPLIDLDLVLDFPPDQPWVPAQELVVVDALPLKNCG